MFYKQEIGDTERRLYPGGPHRVLLSFRVSLPYMDLSFFRPEMVPIKSLLCSDVTEQDPMGPSWDRPSPIPSALAPL